MVFSSWYIFLDHPWFGVGRNILPAMSDLFAKGVITASVAEMADTHGEIFYNMASLAYSVFSRQCGFTWGRPSHFGGRVVATTVAWRRSGVWGWLVMPYLL